MPRPVTELLEAELPGVSWGGKLWWLNVTPVTFPWGYWGEEGTGNVVPWPAVASPQLSARIAEPAGLASTRLRFQTWRQGTLSLVLVALVRSRGPNTASRCACSLPGMFEGDTGPTSGLRGCPEDVFPDGAPVVLLGFPLTRDVPRQVMLVCFLI